MHRSPRMISLRYPIVPGQIAISSLQSFESVSVFAATITLPPSHCPKAGLIFLPAPCPSCPLVIVLIRQKNKTRTAQLQLSRRHLHKASRTAVAVGTTVGEQQGLQLYTHTGLGQ